MKLVRSCSIVDFHMHFFLVGEQQKESDNKADEQEARVSNDCFERTRNMTLTNDKESEA